MHAPGTQLGMHMRTNTRGDRRGTHKAMAGGAHQDQSHIACTCVRDWLNGCVCTCMRACMCACMCACMDKWRSTVCICHRGVYVSSSKHTPLSSHAHTGTWIHECKRAHSAHDVEVVCGGDDVLRSLRNQLQVTLPPVEEVFAWPF